MWRRWDLAMLERLVRSEALAFTEKAVILESARLICSRASNPDAALAEWRTWLAAYGLWRWDDPWQDWLEVSTNDIIAGRPVPQPPPPLDLSDRKLPA